MVHGVEGLAKVNHEASNIRVIFKHVYNVVNKTNQSTGGAASGFECVLVYSTINRNRRAS